MSILKFSLNKTRERRIARTSARVLCEIFLLVAKIFAVDEGGLAFE